jgi:C4-dicarboxylate-specific signal transduction histidine kinase
VREDMMTMSEEGFQFIGKMTASITHEIKNVLAVIRENAGLMEDLIAMGEKKGGVDPARIQSLAEKIGQQAMKADGIVQNMNHFAHSMDDFIADVDLGKTLDLLAALSGRIATVRGVTLKTRVPDAPVWIKTHPILLETLLWGCLDFAMDKASEEKQLGIEVAQPEGESVQIRIAGIDTPEDVCASGFSLERCEAIRRILGAEMGLTTEGDEIVIDLPRQVQVR